MRRAPSRTPNADPGQATGFAVGYVRVSREEQAREGVSLDAQRDRVAAYATAKGLTLVDVIADEGRSGKDLDRPGLQELRLFIWNTGLHRNHPSIRNSRNLAHPLLS